MNRQTLSKWKYSDNYLRFDFPVLGYSQNRGFETTILIAKEF